MGEWRLFAAGTVPEYTTAEWYRERIGASHLEEDTHRPRLKRSAELVARLAFLYGFRAVVDLGAGDGGLLSLLGGNLKAWGYDLCPDNVTRSQRRGVDLRFGDVIEGEVEWGEIAVATEMLEHLVDPHAFVKRIAKSARAIVCSSPWSERPGHAYEFHAWAWDFEGYRALIEGAGFEIWHHEEVGPFQVLAGVRRDA